MGYFNKTTVNQDGILDVEVKDVLESMSKVTLIDVRRPEEYTGELGHIQGAALLTLESDFVKGIEAYDKNQAIVFVCRSGARSSRAAVYALSQGFKEVYNMSGGMIEWNEKGYPTE
jgi:sulfur dioxygenase